MNKHKSDKQILDQATDWFAKLRSDNVSSKERDAFTTWLKSNQQNQQAYQKIESMWGSLDVMSDPTFKQFFAAQHPAVSKESPSNPRTNKQPYFGKRWALAAIPALCVIVICLVVNYTSSQTFKTSSGEQKTVFLDDGSIIHINTNSAIEITMKKDQRLLSLQYGEALFEVSHDKSRPFIVDAGKISVRTIGTAFNIYRPCSKNEDVVITVVDGKVGISEETQKLQKNDNLEHFLNASEQAQYSKISGIGDTKEVNTKLVTAWKDQKLIYDGIPLDKVLEDINRYTKDKITLGEDSLKGIEVSAVFKIQNQETILMSLEQAFGLTAIKQSDATIILKKKKN